MALVDYHVEGKVLTVGQVARRTGVAASALRFYETRGLISSKRNNGGQRRYSRDVLRRVSVIKTAQLLGISLKEIAEALSKLPKSRTPTPADWKHLSRSWQKHLDRRIEHLTLLRDQLDGCIGCGCLSLQVCPLQNPGDVAAEAGPGPIMFSDGFDQEEID